VGVFVCAYVEGRRWQNI